jgi:Zn-dependent protease with chaperone function
MRSALKPLVMVLTIPVLATAVSMLARSSLEARWSAQLVRQLTAQRMRPDVRLLARYSLATLCADQRNGARLPPCRTYNLYASVIGGSAGVAAAGLGFLVCLASAARLCRARSGRMARLFRPSLMFAAAGTGLLAVVNALLAVAGGLAAGTYFSGDSVERMVVSAVLVPGTAAVVWAVAVAAVALSVTRQPPLTVIGLVLDPSENAGLVDEVRRAAETVGAEPPGHLVACLAPWIFATEVRLATLDGALSGRTLCLSLPLCRILSKDELRALVAHELAHFSRNNATARRRLSPFYTGVSRSLDRLQAQSGGLRRLAVAPPHALLTFFMEAAWEDPGPAGDGEMEADRLAGAAAGREALGSALAKAHAFAPAWDAVVGAMLHAVASGTQYLNSSQLFQEVAADNAGPERLLGLGRQVQGHPTDLHPPLARRLGALGLEPQRVAASTLVTGPASPAIELVHAYEAIERRLSVAEHQLMVEEGGGGPGRM